MHSNSWEKEVATQRQTLRHADNIEDKKAIFICLVATPATQQFYAQREFPK